MNSNIAHIVVRDAEFVVRFENRGSPVCIATDVRLGGPCGAWHDISEIFSSDFCDEIHAALNKPEDE